MKRSVLFLCTGNSARSQMAEGFLRHFGGNAFEVASAGTHPAGLHPLAVDAMKDIGIDISHYQSKSIECFLNLNFDYVVTVCDRAKEACPIFPAASFTENWSFDDPAGAQGSDAVRKEAFRRIRDEIGDRVRRFVGNMDTVPR